MIAIYFVLIAATIMVIGSILGIISWRICADWLLYIGVAFVLIGGIAILFAMQKAFIISVFSQ